MVQIVKVFGQAIILLSIGFQFYISSAHNRIDASIETRQTRLWEAEHKLFLKEQSIAVISGGVLSQTDFLRRLEEQREQLFGDERAARAGLIRASQRAVETRNAISIYEDISAFLFILGSVILLFGEILLIKLAKKKPLVLATQSCADSVPTDEEELNRLN